ncbi:ATP-binding protein [Nodosilinea sp. P-1105]|uniref:ATP-binding protein n=1 Tax=Nodosilinea sp. P-1105 TaxID=2546229 RepID=UPI00197D2221|nr:ATP-binding protein [Nodosilinea sp. P-1105]
MVLAIVSVMGCSPATVDHPPIRILGVTYLGDLPTLVAKEQGIFARHGLTTEVTFELSGKDNLEILHNGGTEFALMAPSPFVLDHLLAFARKQPLAPSLVDINALMGHMCQLLQRTLGEQIRVELHCAEALWPVLVDPAQLESALLNLALNARDAMTSGGRLIVEMTNTELDQDYAQAQGNVTPGPYVQITVSDNGCGIPPEHMEHLFEPFFTTKETGKGTGLGLPMVYGFVKQSNGHIMIYSEPQQGTTVKMYFPRVATMDNPELSPQSQTPTTQTTQGSTILVVEDDAMVRRYVESQLLSLGYQVVSACNGPQGLDILQHRPDIDLLFTDMVMPGGMTGCDLVDRARAIRPDLRVLYTSGYTETAVFHHGRLDPGGQLLSKPYCREKLAAKLQAALSNLPTDEP